MGARPVIFLHIPKTAGTSLRQSIAHVYSEERCLFVYDPAFFTDPEQAAAMRERAGRADVVFGHMSYGVHESLGLEARYVTVLREPVARVASFFRHQARDEQSEYYGDIAAGMTLVDLLRSEKCHQVNNHMCRILSGRHTDAAVFDRQELTLAWANVDTQFLAVGLTERLDRSVEAFGRALGWPAAPSVPLLNADPEPDRYPLDEETRAEIERYNALDQRLYRRVATGSSAD
jgi:hypothetical protein